MTGKSVFDGRYHPERLAAALRPTSSAGSSFSPPGRGRFPQLLKRAKIPSPCHGQPREEGAGPLVLLSVCRGKISRATSNAFEALDHGQDSHSWRRGAERRNPHQRRQERGPEADGGRASDARRAHAHQRAAATSGCPRHGREAAPGASASTWMLPGMRHLGEGDTIRLQADKITSSFAPYDMVRKMRASFQVAPGAPWRSQGLASWRLRHRQAGQSSSRCLDADERQGRAQRRVRRGQRQGGLRGAEIRISVRLGGRD